MTQFPADLAGTVATGCILRPAIVWDGSSAPGSRSDPITRDESFVVSDESTTFEVPLEAVSISRFDDSHRRERVKAKDCARFFPSLHPSPFALAVTKEPRLVKTKYKACRVVTRAE